MTVTRHEIAEHVLGAFDHPPAHKNDVLTQATHTEARPEVLETLRSLPEETYPSLRALWRYLPQVPVDA